MSKVSGNPPLWPVSPPSLQPTCSPVWWWCISCCAPSTRWPTCTAWPPSCSCRAARTPCWRMTGRPSWMLTRHHLHTWMTKTPANPWTRAPSRRTTPSTNAELEEKPNVLPLVIPQSVSWDQTPGSVGWIWTFHFFIPIKHPGKRMWCNTRRFQIQALPLHPWCNRSLQPHSSNFNPSSLWSRLGLWHHKFWFLRLTSVFSWDSFMCLCPSQAVEKQVKRS